MSLLKKYTELRNKGIGWACVITAAHVVIPVYWARINLKNLAGASEQEQDKLAAECGIVLDNIQKWGEKNGDTISGAVSVAKMLHGLPIPPHPHDY